MKILIPVTKKGVILLDKAVVIKDDPFKNLINGVKQMIGWLGSIYMILDILISLI